MKGIEAFMPGGIPVMVSSAIPLTRVDRKTGEIVNVAFVRISGRLVFHPERFRELLRALARQDLELALARWADDGGRQDPSPTEEEELAEMRAAIRLMVRGSIIKGGDA